MKRALKKRYGRSVNRPWELSEMKEILVKHGFSAHHAKALQNEGMGPYELRSRAARPPHEVGGLTYTHGIKKERA